MPHTHSAASKRSQQEVKTSRKWLSVLERSFQTLWQEFDAAIGDTLNYIRIRGYTDDWVGKPSWSSMLKVEKVWSCIEFAIYIGAREFGEITIKLRKPNILSKGIGLTLEDVVVWREYSLPFGNENDEDNVLFRTKIQAIVHAWLVRTISAEMCRRRVARFHEELVAAVWHPRRVARLLESGGWDAVDAL